MNTNDDLLKGKIAYQLFQIVSSATIQTIVKFNKQMQITKMVGDMRSVIQQLNENEFVDFYSEVLKQIGEVEKLSGVKINEEVVRKIIGK